MSELLRLDFVRDEMEIALDVGDVCIRVNGSEGILNSDTLASWASKSDCDNQRHIKSFAPRENKGVQHVGDDVVVDCEWVGDRGNVKHTVKHTAAAGSFSWCVPRAENATDEWKPNYASLLKMQNEYDKKESEMITEKEMKIVGAVNALKAAWQWPSSDKVKLKENSSECITISSFNQCIEEMASMWVDKNALQCSYEYHKAKCRAHGIDTSNKRLQKEVTPPIYTQVMKDAGELPSVGMKLEIVNNKVMSADEVNLDESCIVDTWNDGDLVTVIAIVNMHGKRCAVVQHSRLQQVSSIISKCYRPIETRTPAEIEAEELEAAKVKQVDDIHDDSANSGYHVNKRYIKFLQDGNRLAEIISPLKG